MPSLPQSFKSAVLKDANSPLELQDTQLRMPGPGQVLIKVLACGICHTDAFVQAGHLGNPWPLVLGHEMVGDVVAVGDGVKRWKEGDRVGGGWHGGHDGMCRSCQRGQFQMCSSQDVNGVTMDGGYAEYALLRSEAVVAVPRELGPAEVAPFMCAGTTVFNGIRKLHVEQGSLVAVQGLGGLGHLAVQYARGMGYRVVAISRGGQDKRDFAAKLGAHEFIDTSTEDPAKKLSEMGGAALIVATAPDATAMSGLVGGLQNGGKLLVLAPVGPVEFNTGALVTKAASVHGWPSGHAIDSEEAIEFARSHGVRCMINKWELAKANEALEDMKAGKPRFRNVLVME